MKKTGKTVWITGASSGIGEAVAEEFFNHGDTVILSARNRKMLESLLAACHDNTELCIAADITLPGEFIKTKKISEWKSDIPDLKDRLVVFVIQ